MTSKQEALEAFQWLFVNFIVGTKQRNALVDKKCWLIRQALSQPDIDLEGMRKDSSDTYCRALDIASDKCKGAEWKIENGKFGLEDLKSHKQYSELIGFHRGICHVLKALKDVKAKMGGGE